MAASFSVRLDAGAVQRLVGGGAERAARQAADITVSRVKRNIQALGRIDSSEMYRGVTKTAVGTHPLAPAYLIYSTAAHTLFQEMGTANAGAGFIYPRSAKALRFRPKGSAVYVFASRVRGVKPGRFMLNALKALTLDDFLRS